MSLVTENQPQNPRITDRQGYFTLIDAQSQYDDHIFFLRKAIAAKPEGTSALTRHWAKHLAKDLVRCFRSLSLLGSAVNCAAKIAEQKALCYFFKSIANATGVQSGEALLIHDCVVFLAVLTFIQKRKDLENEGRFDDLALLDPKNDAVLDSMVSQHPMIRFDHPALRRFDCRPSPPSSIQPWYKNLGKMVVSLAKRSLFLNPYRARNTARKPRTVHRLHSIRHGATQ